MIADVPTAALPAASLRAILDAMPMPVFLLDREVRVYYANEAARNHFGLDAEAVFLRLCGDALCCAFAADSPGGCGTTPMCSRCVVRGAVARAVGGQRVWREKELFLKRSADGERKVHLLVTAAPAPGAGESFAVVTLQDISELVTLQGLVPVCASCRKVREDDEYWRSVEDYLASQLNVAFTHTICPDCARRLYPDLAERIYPRPAAAKG